VFSEANKILGYDLYEVIQNGPIEKLSDTTITQPAILATSIATLRVLDAMGVKPDVVAGLSLGEYSALVAAGVMTFSDAMAVVARRGEIMTSATPPGVGGMAAIIGAPIEKVNEVINKYANEGVITISNYNCPGQVVIGGEINILAKAMKDLEDVSKKVVALAVSGPFHTALLNQATVDFKEFLSSYELNDPSIPFIGNVTGSYVSTGDEVKDLLPRQISNSVKWEQTLKTMLEEGVECFIECGPGKALMNFVKFTQKEVGKKTVVLNTTDEKALSKLMDKLEVSYE
jgi:[acyl-carrier-protein] S-malonyltransferase